MGAPADPPGGGRMTYDGPERRNPEWAHEIVRETVEETFTRLGFDIEHPLETQEDLAWMRRYRKMCERVGNRVVLTVVTLFTGGIVAALWAYMKGSGG